MFSPRSNGEHGEYYKTNLFIPSFNSATLKFIRRPTSIFASFMYVNICASYLRFMYTHYFFYALQFQYQSFIYKDVNPISAIQRHSSILDRNGNLGLK